MVNNVRTTSLLTFDFVCYGIFASWIAAMGLLENSVVSVVASMLVSPMMVCHLRNLNKFFLIIHYKLGSRDGIHFWNCNQRLEIDSDGCSKRAHVFPNNNRIRYLLSIYLFKYTLTLAISNRLPIRYDSIKLYETLGYGNGMANVHDA